MLDMMSEEWTISWEEVKVYYSFARRRALTDLPADHEDGRFPANALDRFFYASLPAPA